MFDPQLWRFRESVRQGNYELTAHGLEELEEDELSVLDVESCVLTGSIVERQQDRRSGERKYVIEGQALNGQRVTVVAKWTTLARMMIVTIYQSDN